MTSDPSSDPRIIVILLAAGSARRFAGAKLAALLDGIPVVRRAAERALAARTSAVVVVVGGHEATVREALAGATVRFVVNERYSAGMGTSIAAGVSAVAGDADAVIVALADQPGIDPGVFDALREAWMRGPGEVIVPEYANGQQGPPVLFGRSVFAELTALSEDAGARSIIERDAGRVTVIQVDEGFPADIDTRDDLRRSSAGS